MKHTTWLNMFLTIHVFTKARILNIKMFLLKRKQKPRLQVILITVVKVIDLILLILNILNNCYYYL